MTTTSILDAALEWHRRGVCVIPAKPGKRPGLPWTEYQTRTSTEEEIRAWFGRDRYDGFGVVCGAVSGNLEMIEFEGRARHLVDEITDAMIDHGLTDPWTRIATGYAEVTPSNGLHLFYRVDGPAAGNTKLASRPATPEELAVKPAERTKVLLETRGEGGFVVVSPSGGSVHPSGGQWVDLVGEPARIPTITLEEREAMFAVVGMFNVSTTTRSTTTEPTPATVPVGEDGRPGDEFNARSSWEEILLPHGWTRGHTDADGTTYWTRPGKDPHDGISATTRPDGGLFVFTTATEFDSSLETRKAYSKFYVFAVYNHGGDLAAAARDLAGRGYGDQRARVAPTAHRATTRPQEPSCEPVAEVQGEAHPLAVIEEEFFGATAILAKIRQAARARLVSPWAVIGSVLARVTAEAPPHIVLPPVIGSDASLNLAVALVAPSGAGKSGAKACADDLLGLTMPRAMSIGPGTGEGVMQTFLERDPDTKKNVVRVLPLAVLYADEITQIGAVQARLGATFGPIIRTMLTGGSVSTTNAGETFRRHLPAHSYRLTIVSGVQPRLADVLLADEDAGTPQRWVWLPATDPLMPEVEPAWPGTIGWSLPRTPRPDPDGRVRIEIPEAVRHLIRATHRARQRGDGDPLDGHRLLTQEKVAAAIALLHGEVAVTEEAWRLATLLMQVSAFARGVCEEAIRGKQDEEKRARGRGDVIREAGAREARVERSTHHARLLWRTVSRGDHPNAKHAPDAGCTRRCLTFAMRSHKDADLDTVIATAVAMGWIEERDERWWPGDSQPADES